jgi:hypothetical protein
MARSVNNIATAMIVDPWGVSIELTKVWTKSTEGGNHFEARL